MSISKKQVYLLFLYLIFFKYIIVFFCKSIFLSLFSNVYFLSLFSKVYFCFCFLKHIFCPCFKRKDLLGKKYFYLN